MTGIEGRPISIDAEITIERPDGSMALMRVLIPRLPRNRASRMFSLGPGEIQDILIESVMF